MLNYVSSFLSAVWHKVGIGEGMDSVGTKRRRRSVAAQIETAGRGGSSHRLFGSDDGSACARIGAGNLLATPPVKRKRLENQEVALDDPGNPPQPRPVDPDLLFAAMCVVVGTGQAPSPENEKLLPTVKMLQLASRGICRACRENTCFLLTVDAETPRRLFPAGGRGRSSLRSRGSANVTHMRIVSVKWRRSVRDMANGLALPRSLRTICFGQKFNAPVDKVDWPARTNKIYFSTTFNRSLNKMRFPPELKHLIMGRDFKKDISSIVWPSSKSCMAFSSAFNRPMENVTLPPSLQSLVITGRFNQPLRDVNWPAKLRELHVICLFNHPLDGVRWPPGLCKITFASFNQPIEGVAWPEGLEHLTFMFEFDQPIAGVRWPAGLQCLRLGADFNQPLNGVRWPPGLKLLFIGRNFTQPYRRSDMPDGVVVEQAVTSQDEQLIDQLQPVD